MRSRTSRPDPARVDGDAAERRDGVDRGAPDAVLARALAAMHEDLAKDWNVDSIAHAAGTSRATLGRRFVSEVGESPVAYLARARMEEAARQPQVGDDGLARVARTVGYASEFAFNRAFRRAIGEPPGTYRDRMRRARI